MPFTYTDTDVQAALATLTDWKGQGWTTDRIEQRIQTEAAQYKNYPQLPQLARAVMMQESELSPNAVGDNGKSLGLFQLQPGAATDVGIAPRVRHEPGANIYGGVKYLKLKLDQSKGNTEEALRRYNGGGDPNYVKNVMRWLKPGVAEAAPPAQTWTYTDADVAAALATLGGASPAPATGQEMPQQQPEPPSDLTIDIEKTSPVAPLPATTPVAPSGVGVWLPSLTPQPEAPGTTTAQRMAGVDTMLEDARTRANKNAPAVFGGAAAGMVGRAIGTALAPTAARVIGGAARVVPPLAEAAGSYGGRQAMVGLGLEEPGTLGDIASVAVPLGASAIGGAVKRAVPTLPGANPTMHTMAHEGLEQLPVRLAPAGASAPLYQAANASNAAISTVSVWRHAGQILRREEGFGSTTRNAQAAGVARELLDLSRHHRGQVPLRRLDEYRQRISRMAREASAAGNREAPELRQLHSAIMDDLERAGDQGIPGGRELVQAIRSDRKEHAIRELADLWSEGKGLQYEAGNITHVYGKRIQVNFAKKLTDDPHFARSFTREEVADIQETLTDVARLTQRTPTTESGWTERTIRSVGAAAGVGTAFSGHFVGGTALAIATQAIPDLIAWAMQTGPGRTALRVALQEGQGRLTNAGLRGIAAAIGAQRLPSDAPVPGTTP